MHDSLKDWENLACFSKKKISLFIFKVFQAFIPGVTGELKDGDELEFDPSAYHMLHSFTTG